MDSRITRRGRPCTYKVDNIGLSAVNDALIPEHLVYQIIKRRFGTTNLYPKLLETILGQSLDTRFSVNWNTESQSPTLQLRQSVSILKASYYTINLPIALAMVLVLLWKH